MSACESGLMEYIRYLSINIEFLSTDGMAYVKSLTLQTHTGNYHFQSNQRTSKTEMCHLGLNVCHYGGVVATFGRHFFSVTAVKRMLYSNSEFQA
ncbi:hypothetical protein DERP_002284 [Dermatophagoides pteronyssinus]|uniref:Uncharacterized protein n=1 Tax=Dermatophagoides pteronyssinus TaxID=6956 RepID=A0ABQ8JHE2_DERPT|nr:hypothetical protein DERP_002284 [Dermatophagoides pteronyssinus]